MCFEFRDEDMTIQLCLTSSVDHIYIYMPQINQKPHCSRGKTEALSLHHKRVLLYLTTRAWRPNNLHWQRRCRSGVGGNQAFYFPTLICGGKWAAISQTGHVGAPTAHTHTDTLKQLFYNYLSIMPGPWKDHNHNPSWRISAMIVLRLFGALCGILFWSLLDYAFIVVQQGTKN